MDLENLYSIAKALHIIFMTTWMAGLFYLPRLFVYHAKAQNSEINDTFIIMEKKLYNYIMNPSLLITWALGLSLMHLTKSYQETWIILKIILVFSLTLFHVYCGKIKNNFIRGVNTKSEQYYRVINEVPTVIFLAIIFLVVFKPFN